LTSGFYSNDMEKENNLKVVYCVIDKGNYYQEPVTIRIFSTKEKAIKFCDDHKDREYEWEEMEVE
jgi:hypothetical protein